MRVLSGRSDDSARVVPFADQQFTQIAVQKVGNEMLRWMLRERKRNWKREKALGVRDGGEHPLSSMMYGASFHTFRLTLRRVARATAVREGEADVNFVLFNDYSKMHVMNISNDPSTRGHVRGGAQLVSCRFA